MDTWLDDLLRLLMRKVLPRSILLEPFTTLLVNGIVIVVLLRLSPPQDEDARRLFTTVGLPVLPLLDHSSVRTLQRLPGMREITMLSVPLVRLPMLPERKTSCTMGI